MIEAITYVFCQDKDVTQDNFYKIFSTRGVTVINRESEDKIEVDDLMNFIMTATRGQHLSAELDEHLRKVFSDILGKGNKEISFEEFKK